MSIIKKIATAGAVAVMGLGLGAASASADVTLTPNPFAFSGDQVGVNSFSAGGLTIECDTANFSGNTSNSTNVKVPFHAEYADCTLTLFGIPFAASVTTNSDWNLDYVSDDGTTATTDVSIDAPSSGTAVVLHVPAIGCQVNIGAQSGLSEVSATNVSGGVDLSAVVDGIAWSQNGNCLGMASSGTDGEYNGDVHIPGITMTF